MTKPTAPRSNPSPAASVALAACAFELPASVEGNRIDIQLTPAGSFKPRDGRKMTVPAWHIDQAVATKVIERFNARRTPPVVDYEHQTLHKETNGQPAPAAAWMRALQWRDTGLWATVELTSRAAELINAGEYAYVSPVFHFHPQTGEVLAIEMAALTNNPAIDGMQPLAQRAAATFGHFDFHEETPMKLLNAVLMALSLPATTTEDDAVAALSALQPKLETLAVLNTQLGVQEGADPTTAIAACTALKTAANAAAPDPAKYVGVEVVEALRTDLAALTAKTANREVGELVDAGLADGRLLPAQKDWATSLGKKDLAALSGYLATATPIAALSGTQTGGAAPQGAKDANGLTPAELAICSATGIDPKDFAAAKPAA